MIMVNILGLESLDIVILLVRVLVIHVPCTWRDDTGRLGQIDTSKTKQTKTVWT